MRVKQIADALEISADSVRYYTRIGFLVPSKSHNGYKYYRPALVCDDVNRISLISLIEKPNERALKINRSRVTSAGL